MSNYLLHLQRWITWAGLLILLFSAAACNFPGATPSALPVLESTQAAQTVVAELTEQAPPIPMQTTTPVANLASATAPMQPSPSPSPTPTRVPSLTPSPTPSLELLFKDDFSSEIGWYTDLGENFGFSFANGGYQIYVDIPFANIWSIREKVYSDIVVEVDAALTLGPQTGYYGLICRHVDNNQYYGFVISSDGFYGIGKMEEDEFEFIQEGQDTSGVIKTGMNVVNRLRADCIGDQLRLYVNGEQLLEVQDDDILEGNVGMMIGTRKEVGVTVLFDNFAVFQP